MPTLPEANPEANPEATHDRVRIVNRPTAQQLSYARRLLEAEGAGADVGVAAGRVYEKLQEHMAPLLGALGVQMLVVRSARLANLDFAGMADPASGQTSARLRDAFKGRDRAVADEQAAALFGTFFGLLINFIGARLTDEVTRRAWPSLGEPAERESGS